MPIPTQPPAEKQSSAKEKVYQQVARWIIDGTMVPGEKLNEGEIAAWFSVSRTPVHEALMLLAEHHFVEVLPSRGSYVSKLSLEEADGVYEAISALNGVLTGLASEKRTEADLDDLRSLNQRFDDALRAGDSEAVDIGLPHLEGGAFCERQIAGERASAAERAGNRRSADPSAGQIDGTIDSKC